MAAGLSLASTSSQAFNAFNNALVAKYPATAVNNCGNCHTDAGPPATNAYGTRINAVRSTTSANSAAGTEAINAIDAEDSDGDGFVNSVELAAGSNAGLADSHPAATTTTTTSTTTTTPATTTTTPATTTTTAATTTTTPLRGS